MRILKVATCSLNQWSMDFDNNINNIKESITLAKDGGATIRLGPELEITGYGCEDHFFEPDTVTHAWECLTELLVGDWTDGILCSFGMPVVRGSERYNCQVLCLNRKIVMIRPKMWLANGVGCSELRWFTAWKQKEPRLDTFRLPAGVAEAISQPTAPIGYGYIQFLDTAVAAEICIELFCAVQTHPELALNGVEVFLNASGSIHMANKTEFRLRAMTSAVSNRGGVYMYSNHLGCDGGRYYYDGCSCIVANGDVVAKGQQFSLKNVDVVFAQLDLDKVTSVRGSNSSFSEQASCKVKVPSIFVDYKLCHSFKPHTTISTPLKIEYPSHEEEIGMGAACWLWNYLKRSGASGFLLPLSDGVGSSSVAAIVGSMCQLVVKEITNGDEQVKADAIRIGHYNNGQFPVDSKEFAKRIFYTVFMSCEGSSKQSRVVAEEIGSWHLDISINGVVSAFLSLYHTISRTSFHQKEEGDTDVENSAMQSIQSRTKMVVAFMLASLLPWLHRKPGFYLVLSTTTSDEGLCGNFTKYGSSSGDINPVGSINKKDLGEFLKWAASHLGYSSLAPQSNARSNPNDAEAEAVETEEELSTYGRLRNTMRCGPVSMFENLCEKWGSKLSSRDIGEKMKHFFKWYSINRHKMSVQTPSYIMERYSCDDNRLDQRQMVYNPNWLHQFRKIDELVQQHELNEEVLGESSIK